jgi:hypothetical protein
MFPHPPLRTVLMSIPWIIAMVHSHGNAEEIPSDQVEHVSAKTNTGESAANETTFEPRPRGKKILNVDHVLGGQYAPLGILYQVDPYFRWDLFPETDNILLEDAHIRAGLTVVLTPAVAYYGPSFTIAPLSILHLNVQFTHVISGISTPAFGLLDYNGETGGQYADYDYYSRVDDGDRLGRFTARIWSLFLKPSVFLQAGPVVFVYLGLFMYYHPTNVKGLYYNDIADLILTPNSWCLMNEAILAFEIANLKEDGWGLLVGASNQINIAIDDGSDLMETAYRWKVGPALIWTITDQWFNYRIEQPTLMFEGHYYIEDPIAHQAKRPFGAILAFMISTNWYE